jgi:hypothetical protein
MGCAMVDYFSLAITHGLLALAAWRLVWRADPDADPAEQPDDAASAAPPPARPANRGRRRA